MAEDSTETTHKNIAKRTHEMMERKIVRDSLTGLYNKAYFLKEIGRVDSNQPGTMALIDIDNFKTTNDTYGHLAGDKVLRSVARIFQSSIQVVGNGGGPDLLARWGGEEFVVYFKNFDDQNLIGQRLEQIRAQVEASFVEEKEKEVKVTISIGASIRKNGEGVDELFTRTDKALYEAKSAGRNRIEFSKE